MHSDAQACPQTCPASVPFDNPVSSAFSEGAERNSWLGPVPPPAGRDTERHARHPERLFPAHPVIRSILRKEAEPGYFTSRIHPRRAGWNATIAGRYIDRRPSGGPPESSRHFSINSSEPFLPRQLEIARTRRRLPPQQHLPEDTGHARVTSEFADVGRCPARIPRIEMFPASVDKLFLHRFSLQ